MGRKLIIKGADFSANAVSISKTYVEYRFGTSESLWSNATTNMPNLTYGGVGFEILYDGYTDKLIIQSFADGSVDFNINETPDGEATRKIYTETIPVVTGLQTIQLSQISIKASEAGITRWLGLSNGTGNCLKYGSSSGDVQTFTDGNRDANPHAVAYNFVILKEDTVIS